MLKLGGGWGIVGGMLGSGEKSAIGWNVEVGKRNGKLEEFGRNGKHEGQKELYG